MNKLVKQPISQQSTQSTNKSTSALIELSGITRVYGEGDATVYALRGVNLQINDGEFVAVMGASGSGKSTCMNIIGCLDKLSSGDYFFKGVDVSKLNRNQRALLRRHYLGFVFQGYNLLHRTSALENVELPLMYRGISPTKRRLQAMHALEVVGLKGRESHSPSELSGGQQQRVAIARAIVSEPAVLLADEPTGNLDSEYSHEIMQLLTAFNREKNITIIMITHEQDMAEYADRIIRFVDGAVDSDIKNISVYRPTNSDKTDTNNSSHTKNKNTDMANYKTNKAVILKQQRRPLA